MLKVSLSIVNLLKIISQIISATQIVRQKILSVADKFRGKITFAISNEEEFDDELKNVGLDDSGEDINVAIYGENDLKYANLLHACNELTFLTSL